MFRHVRHTEHAFRSDLVKHLELHGALAVPVESRATTRGLADLLVVWNGATGLVELKDVHGPMAPRLRPSQRAFCRRCAATGASYLLVARHSTPGGERYSLRDPRICDESPGVYCATVDGIALTLLQFIFHPLSEVRHG
jgi:hypothetical protein